MFDYRHGLRGVRIETLLQALLIVVTTGTITPVLICSSINLPNWDPSRCISSRNNSPALKCVSFNQEWFLPLPINVINDFGTEYVGVDLMF
uniref:Uncharacterized protein n=1 Tax=Romanomermis culicivorax TaxID=13658 RepID=A0A915I5B2_ROMCU